MTLISNFSSSNLLKYLYENDEPADPPAKNKNVFLSLSILYLFFISSILLT